MVKQAVQYIRPKHPEFAPYQAGLHLHHIDNNPANNNPYNLVYITPTEHRRIHNSKLTKKKVLYIRRQLLLGVHVRILASKLHISGATIRMLIAGHTWKDVQLAGEEVKQLKEQKVRRLKMIADKEKKGGESTSGTGIGHFIQTYLSADVHRALRIYSIEKDKPVHKIVKELITNFIKEKENGKDESNE